MHKTSFSCFSLYLFTPTRWGLTILLPRFHVPCSVLAFYVFSTWRRHVALVFLD